MDNFSEKQTDVKIAENHLLAREAGALSCTDITYERFLNTKYLLHHQYQQFIMSVGNDLLIPTLSKMMNILQYNNVEYEKLLLWVGRWNDLKAPVPVKYIEFIGLKPSNIETTALSDMKAFKMAMKQTYYPRCFFINTSSGILRVSLPPGVIEKEAIEIATRYEVPEVVKAKYICIKDLKTIVIEPSGRSYTFTYPPVLSLRKNLFIPGQVRDPLAEVY